MGSSIMNKFKAHLSDYKLNKKNSSPGRQQTLIDPAEKPFIALDISEIYIEDKTENLLKIKKGRDIEFSIDQTIYLDDRCGDYETYVSGAGYGQVESIEDFMPEADKEEYQEIKIKLNLGYAEDL